MLRAWGYNSYVEDSNSGLKTRLSGRDFDPDLVPDLSVDEAIKLLAKHCPKSKDSKIVQTNFMQYLHGQITCVHNSV